MKKWLALPALVILLAAEGERVLPQSREMESLQLVTALAVDGGGEVSVTAVTAARASEAEESEVLTGAGRDLAAACQSLQGESSRRAYLGQTEQLLLGAEADVGGTLRYVLEQRQLRLDTLLYIVNGPAGPALAASVDRVAQEESGHDPRGRTVGELLPRLAEGEQVMAPALSPGEDGTLRPAGWAVLDQNGVVRFLEDGRGSGA